jgi:hypothetical protein
MAAFAVAVIAHRLLLYPARSAVKRSQAAWCEQRLRE